MALSRWTRSAGGYVARSGGHVYEARSQPYGSSGLLWTLYCDGRVVSTAVRRSLRTCKEEADRHERSTK